MTKHMLAIAGTTLGILLILTIFGGEEELTSSLTETVTDEQESTTLARSEQARENIFSPDDTSRGLEALQETEVAQEHIDSAAFYAAKTRYEFESGHRDLFVEWGFSADEIDGIMAEIEARWKAMLINGRLTIKPDEPGSAARQMELVDQYSYMSYLEREVLSAQQFEELSRRSSALLTAELTESEMNNSELHKQQIQEREQAQQALDREYPQGTEAASYRNMANIEIRAFLETASVPEVDIVLDELVQLYEGRWGNMPQMRTGSPQIPEEADEPESRTMTVQDLVGEYLTMDQMRDFHKLHMQLVSHSIGLSY